MGTPNLVAVECQDEKLRSDASAAFPPLPVQYPNVGESQQLVNWRLQVLCRRGIRGPGPTPIGSERALGV